MASKDLHNSIKAVVALQPQSITTNTTTVGEVVDTLGHESVEFIVAAGSLADAALVPAVTECDTSGGTYTAVADADLLGTEAGAALAATDDATAAKIGYLGSKRFVKLSLVSTGASGANLVGAVAVLGHARTSASNEAQTA